METYVRAFRLHSTQFLTLWWATPERCPPEGPVACPLTAGWPISRSGRRHLDAVDLGVVLDADELDGDGAGSAGGGGERFVDRLELSAGRGEDVEAGQDLVAVDEDVEGAIAGRRPVLLGEVQLHRVARPGGKAGDRVGEVAVPVVLV